jgi:lysozyme family protein
MTGDELFATVILPWLQQEEGSGYVEDPVPTCCGITQGAWDSWTARPPAAPTAVSSLDWSQPWVAEFYRTQYWQAAECDKIAALGTPLALGFAVVTMDTAVNSGVHEADVLLQGALGVPQDGAIGPQTLGAVAAAVPRALEDLVWLRMDYDRAAAVHNPKLVIYLPTWCGRVRRVRTLALSQR